MKACRTSVPVRYSNPARKAQFLRQRRIWRTLQGVFVFVASAIIIAFLIIRFATDATHSKVAAVLNHVVFGFSMFGIMVIDINYAYPYCRHCLGM